MNKKDMKSVPAVPCFGAFPVAFLALVLLFVCASSSLAQALNPGARATLTKDGVNHMVQRALPNVLSQLQSIPVPDQHGTASSPIGDINYNITDIVISGLKVGALSLDLTPPSTLRVSVTGVCINVDLAWSYVDVKYPDILHDSGTATANSSSSLFWVAASFTESQGRPQVVVTNSNVTIGDLTIIMHGGQSWLYNLIEGLFQDFLVQSMEESVEKALVTTVNQQVAEILSTLDLDVKLDDTASVDFSMTGPPTVTSSYLSVPDKGQFYANSDHSTVPGSPVSTPEISDSNPLQFYLTSYVLASASFVYQQAGKLDYRISQKDISSSVHLQLNTATFKYLVPALYNKYPDQDMIILGSCPSPPVANITSAGISAEFDTNMDFRVLNKDGSATSAFVISAVAQSSGTASVSGTSLMIKLAYLSATLKTQSSTVGPVDVSAISDIVDTLLKSVITPLLNLFISPGIPIPSVQGLELVHPEVKFSEGFLFVSTDIDYHPPSPTESHPRRDSSHRVSVLVHQHDEEFPHLH